MVLLNMSLWKQNKLTLKGCSSIASRTCRWMNPTMKGSVKGPPLHCDIALNEAKSWVDTYTSSVSSWSTPNDSWLSLLLLEEVAVILSSWCTIDFLLGIYINLEGGIIFIKKKNRQHLLYMRSYPKFLILQIDNIYSRT
jgi:hypothetical protein